MTRSFEISAKSNLPDDSVGATKFLPLHRRNEYSREKCWNWPFQICGSWPKSLRFYVGSKYKVIELVALELVLFSPRLQIPITTSKFYNFKTRDAVRSVAEHPQRDQNNSGAPKDPPSEESARLTCLAHSLGKFRSEVCDLAWLRAHTVRKAEAIHQSTHVTVSTYTKCPE